MYFVQSIFCIKEKLIRVKWTVTIETISYETKAIVLFVEVSADEKCYNFVKKLHHSRNNRVQYKQPLLRRQIIVSRIEIRHNVEPNERNKRNLKYGRKKKLNKIIEFSSSHFPFTASFFYHNRKLVELPRVEYFLVFTSDNAPIFFCSLSSAQSLSRVLQMQLFFFLRF